MWDNLAVQMVSIPHSSKFERISHPNAFKTRVGPVLILVLALFTLANCPTHLQARGLPVQEGILNYGKVSDSLYRGAQPDSAGLKSLKRLGVKMIVNLRMPGDGWKEEAAEAQA